MNPIELAFLLRRDFPDLGVVVEQGRVVVLEARPEDRAPLERLGVEVRCA